MQLKTKDKIHMMRRQMEMSLKVLGKELGVYYNTIWSWEAGITTPNVDMYENLCKLYEKTTGEKRPE
jgi:DNA-binding XRE family transcriptional regulator